MRLPALRPFLERLLPALLRVVERHRFGREGLCVVDPARPLQHRLVLWMLGVRDRLQELRKAVDAAAVLWWAPARARHTARVRQPGLGRLHPLVHDYVFPVVAEVVRVDGWRRVPGPPLEELGKGDFPSGQDRPILGFVVVRDADRHDRLLIGVEQPELVKVIVEPAHRVLNGDVQIPERVLRGHLDATPDERFGAAQHDEELVHQRGRRGALRSLAAN